MSLNHQISILNFRASINCFHSIWNNFHLRKKLYASTPNLDLIVLYFELSLTVSKSGMKTQLKFCQKHYLGAPAPRMLKFNALQLELYPWLEFCLPSFLPIWSFESLIGYQISSAFCFRFPLFRCKLLLSLGGSFRWELCFCYFQRQPGMKNEFIHS